MYKGVAQPGELPPFHPPSSTSYVIGYFEKYGIVIWEGLIWNVEPAHIFNPALEWENIVIYVCI